MIMVMLDTRPVTQGGADPTRGMSVDYEKNFGIIDVAAMPKDAYYLYQSLWSDKPMVHLLPHWTHTGKEGKIVPVVVYMNCDSVELFLNNVSLGIQPYTGRQLIWHIPYEAGRIEAKAKIGNEIVATDMPGKAVITVRSDKLVEKKITFDIK